MKTPVHVAVTGAAGQIAYSLLFRIAAGDLFGPHQPVVLKLLDVPSAERVLEGVAMELDDCASPLLHGIRVSSDAGEVFDGAEAVFMLGATPRGPGMERRDLLQVNADIFSAQGRALNEAASRRVKILVVGNPANTNALIAQRNAPDLAPECFSAMSRLDHNRATSLLARHCGCNVAEISRIAIWGNHSPTQYPDLHHALVKGRPALSLVDPAWYVEVFIPTVQQRGASVIAIRGKSSAASAANAALDHMRSWLVGTPKDDWVSMTVASDGSYGIAEGLMFSFPVTIENGRFRIVQNLPLNTFSRERLRLTEAELLEERAMVSHLI
ncbi:MULTISPECIES: malate dehydrogenase [Methylococcus]|uniref:Malate dehydrogenase n=1 Tax=Methylococcus capsulatus TaxID=414 RepID=A0ABZ2F4L1_METCP|nr:MULTISPECIES: malate dehydrogenase [Methylococcus]MDF9392317.1 malate dehydrogenase [Methylococcus capsulatus]